VCDLSPKAECVPAFAHESEHGPFVPEVLKTVWTMCWKRWYDCISYAFRSFSEDEKESRINGWRRNRRSAQSLLPAVRAVDGGFSAGGCGASCERFQSGWRLSSRKRRCPKEFSGALWPFRRIMGTENVADASHGQRRKSCIFCATVVNEKDFLTVQKSHRCNQRRAPPAAQKLRRHRQR
jgi:hypothetical protein